MVNLVPQRELYTRFCWATCDSGEFSATTSRLVSRNWFQKDSTGMGEYTEPGGRSSLWVREEPDGTFGEPHVLRRHRLFVGCRGCCTIFHSKSSIRTWYEPRKGIRHKMVCCFPLFRGCRHREYFFFECITFPDKDWLTHNWTPLRQTVSAIYAFFKAMALHPEVAAAAQAEIDSVIGLDRLPSFADRDDLPYVNAVVLEVMRWHSVVPTGKS